jgi:hypothetical protein
MVAELVVVAAGVLVVVAAVAVVAEFVVLAVAGVPSSAAVAVAMRVADRGGGGAGRRGRRARRGRGGRRPQLAAVAVLVADRGGGAGRRGRRRTPHEVSFEGLGGCSSGFFVRDRPCPAGIRTTEACAVTRTSSPQRLELWRLSSVSEREQAIASSASGNT